MSVSLGLRTALVWGLVHFLVLGSPGAEVEKSTIKLTSGETMTGQVGSVRDGSLSLITDYGAVRIPVDKLTPESKSKLGITDKVDVAALQLRIRELEDTVAKLREENASLRKTSAAPTPSTAQQFTGGGTAAAARAASRSEPSATGLSYSLSSTGKRHNSRCRYFGSGRSCSPTDGVACKICGG